MVCIEIVSQCYYQKTSREKIARWKAQEVLQIEVLLNGQLVLCPWTVIFRILLYYSLPLVLDNSLPKNSYSWHELLKQRKGVVSVLPQTKFPICFQELCPILDFEERNDHFLGKGRIYTYPFPFEQLGPIERQPLNILWCNQCA